MPTDKRLNAEEVWGESKCLPGRHIFVTEQDHCLFCKVKKGEEQGIEDNKNIEEALRLTAYRKSLLREMKYKNWKEVCDAVQTCPEDYRPARKNIHY